MTKAIPLFTFVFAAYAETVTHGYRRVRTAGVDMTPRRGFSDCLFFDFGDPPNTTRSDKRPVMEDEKSKLKLITVLTEDLSNVRISAIETAEKAGFDVIQHQNSEDVVQTLERHADIRAVFTDIMISGSMNGLELAETIRKRWPHVEIAVTSGYASPRHENLPPRCVFIPKPFNLNLIAATLRLWARVGVIVGTDEKKSNII